MTDANGACFQQRPQVKPEAKNSARAKPQTGPRQNASKTTRQAPPSRTDPATALKKPGNPQRNSQHSRPYQRLIDSCNTFERQRSTFLLPAPYPPTCMRYGMCMDICVSDITELECLRALAAPGAAGSVQSKETQLSIPAGNTYGPTAIKRIKSCGATSPRLHIVLPKDAKRPHIKNIVFHRYVEPKGVEQFIDFGAGVTGLSIEHFYVSICSRLTFIQRLQLGFELCGWYAIVPNPEYEDEVQQGKTAFKTVAAPRSPLTTVEKLTNFAQANRHIRGAGIALKALRYVADNARSPEEAKMAIVMRLPYRLGGYNRGPLHMDYLVDGTSGLRRCDVYLEIGKVDVEYGSTLHHASAKAMQEDSRRTNELEALGVSVVNITSKELRDPKLFHIAMMRLARIQGRPIHIQIDDFEARRTSLWNALFPKPATTKATDEKPTDEKPTDEKPSNESADASETEEAQDEKR